MIQPFYSLLLRNMRHDERPTGGWLGLFIWLYDLSDPQLSLSLPCTVLLGHKCMYLECLFACVWCMCLPLFTFGDQKVTSDTLPHCSSLHPLR